MSDLQQTGTVPPVPSRRSGHESDASNRRTDGDAAPPGGFDKRQPKRSEGDRDRFAPLPIIPF